MSEPKTDLNDEALPRPVSLTPEEVQQVATGKPQLDWHSQGGPVSHTNSSPTTERRARGRRPFFRNNA
jgi:hypothetical protein